MRRATVVFDSPTPGGAGPFAFRFWLDDVTPPHVRSIDRVARGGLLRARAADRGAGIDPQAVFYSVDGGELQQAVWSARRREATLDVSGLAPGRHRLLLRVSDRQEAKNTENAGPILRNTAFVRTTFAVPRAG